MKQTEFVSKYADNSAFIALLNCAEVGQRNRISSKLPISVQLSFLRKFGKREDSSVFCFENGFQSAIIIDKNTFTS